jgi:hypothetical protein
MIRKKIRTDNTIPETIARIEAELAWFAEYKEFVAFMQAYAAANFPPEAEQEPTQQPARKE